VTHVDIADRVGQTANCADGSQYGGQPLCRTDLPVDDGNGHGTHVAATAAGTCYGVAKGATIHPIKASPADPGACKCGVSSVSRVFIVRHACD